MENITPQIRKRLLWIVILLILILGFSIDLYSPSFPAIETSLNTTRQLVQLTISTYFLGYVIGMLFYGPISDALGRKKPLLFGLGLYFVLSILCSFSTSIYTLLILRFFQGCGVASVGVMFRSILSDVFTGKSLATGLNYSSMSYRIGPIIAPFIGGYLEVYFGWPSNFYFLAGYCALLILLVAIFLPETHTELIPLRMKEVANRYLCIFRYPVFLAGSICIGILYGMMIMVNVVGPFFIQNILNYSPIAYGHIAFGIGICAFLGILTNRFFIHKSALEKIIRFGMASMLLICIMQTIFSFIYPVNLFSFVIPVILVLYLSGFVVSNMMSELLDLIPRGKGTVSALLGIIIICTTGTLTALSSFLKSSTILPFSCAYLVLMSLCYLIYQLSYQRKKKKKTNS